MARDEPKLTPTEELAYQCAKSIGDSMKVYAEMDVDYNRAVDMLSQKLEARFYERYDNLTRHYGGDIDHAIIHILMNDPADVDIDFREAIEMVVPEEEYDEILSNSSENRRSMTSGSRKSSATKRSSGASKSKTDKVPASKTATRTSAKRSTTKKSTAKTTQRRR